MSDMWIGPDERVIDISAGYADPDGFHDIKSPGKTPSAGISTVVPSSGNAVIRGKNLWQEGRGHHLVQLAEIGPGDRKYLHRHHHAETVWVVIQGTGEFFSDLNTAIPVSAGTMCHAYPGEWHGIHNSGLEPLRYLSIEGPMLQRPGSNEFAE